MKDLRENNFRSSVFIADDKKNFPALIVVLAAGLVWGWLELLPADYELLGRQVVAAALFIPNILFWNEAGYFEESAHLKPLLHLWSLGVEEQFYIFWPLLLFCLAKWRPKLPTVLLIITATSFAYGCHLISADPVAAFYSPFPRIWELSIGALLAAWPSKLRYDFLSETVKITLGIAAVGALGAAAFLFRPDSQFPGALAALPTLGTAMLIWAGPHRPII